jgi:selenocysteine-specific elongation factor
VSSRIVAVIGHVDHGKTALVRALTGMETDRLPEERARGVSIALGFAHAEIGTGVDFIDAPGHERFVRALVAGVTGADTALLTVSASEGLRPQSVEHLQIARFLGVSRILVVVTKIDLVDGAAAQSAGAAAAALVRAYGLDPQGPVLTSAKTGEGLDQLRAALAGLGSPEPQRQRGFVWLPIDRSFVVQGQGRIVAGTVRGDALKTDQPLEILPQREVARVRSLQSRGACVPQADIGVRAAVGLRGSPLAPRGSVLATAGVVRPSEWMGVWLICSASGPGLTDGERLDLLIGASRRAARLRLLTERELGPGQAAAAQLRCSEPAVSLAREHFVVRRPSPSATLGGGFVIDPAAERLSRASPLAAERLCRLAALDGEALAQALLEEAAPGALALNRFAEQLGVSRDLAEQAARRAGWRVVAGDLLACDASLAVLAAELRRKIEREPDGALRRELNDGFDPQRKRLADVALASLIQSGAARLDGGRVRLVELKADQARAAALDALEQEWGRRLRDGGLSPPDLISDARSGPERRVLDQLVKKGVAVRTLDTVQKRHVLFHRDAVQTAQEILRELLAPPGLRVGEIGQALGISRKYSVPLLEHLDAVRFTRRLGDRRLLGPGGRV